MNKKLLWGIPVLIFLLGGVAWLNAGTVARRSLQTAIPPVAMQATTPPTIGLVAAMPNLIAVNAPTAVTVTAVITDPNVIPSGVNLLRLNANGTPAILGVMRDDGTNGDAAANDRTYSLRVIFSEAISSQIQLQISAAFRGLLRRISSSVFLLSVGQSFRHPSGLYDVIVPPSFNLSAPASLGDPNDPLNPAHSELFAGTNANEDIDQFGIDVFALRSSITVHQWVNENDVSLFPSDRIIVPITLAGYPALSVSSPGQGTLALVTIVQNAAFILEWPNFDPADVNGLNTFYGFAASWHPR